VKGSARIRQLRLCTISCARRTAALWPNIFNGGLRLLLDVVGKVGSAHAGQDRTYVSVAQLSHLLRGCMGSHAILISHLLSDCMARTPSDSHHSCRPSANCRRCHPLIHTRTYSTAARATSQTGGGRASVLVRLILTASAVQPPHGLAAYRHSAHSCASKAQFWLQT